MNVKRNPTAPFARSGEYVLSGLSHPMVGGSNVRNGIGVRSRRGIQGPLRLDRSIARAGRSMIRERKRTTLLLVRGVLSSRYVGDLQTHQLVVEEQLAGYGTLSPKVSPSSIL